jgi:hypothetical protein
MLSALNGQIKINVEASVDAPHLHMRSNEPYEVAEQLM